MIHIKLGGRTWPIRFDMYAIEEIQKRYGSMTDLSEMAQNPGEIAWLLSIVINEGQKYQAFETGAPCQLVEPEQIGTLLTPADLASEELANAIVDALNEGLGSKKYTAAGLQEIGKLMMQTGRLPQMMSR